ncbi:MAG: hypothetical protein ACYS72_07190, partial [Planctomycetota bacterium]
SLGGPSMFELEKAIQNWRSGLLQSQNVLESDADELENHVRDEVDSLILAGLSAEEAFMVSSHRIGDNEAVGQEFAKVNPGMAWRRRAFWMFFGILVSILVGGIATLCSQGSAALLVWLNVSAYGSGIASILIHIGVFMALLFAVIFGLSLFAKSVKSKFSMSMALVFCIISIFAITALEVNIFGMETFGQLVLASRYGIVTWNILWPIILVALLFVLWPSRPQRVR